MASDSGTKYIVRPFGHLILRPTSYFRSPALASDAFDFWLETFPCKRKLILFNHPHLQGGLEAMSLSTTSENFAFEALANSLAGGE